MGPLTGAGEEDGQGEEENTGILSTSRKEEIPQSSQLREERSDFLLKKRRVQSNHEPGEGYGG